MDPMEIDKTTKLNKLNALLDKARADERTKCALVDKPRKQTALILFAMWAFTLGMVFFGAFLWITPPPQNVGTLNLIVGFLTGSVVGPIITWGFRTSIHQMNKPAEKEVESK